MKHFRLASSLFFGASSLLWSPLASAQISASTAWPAGVAQSQLATPPSNPIKVTLADALERAKTMSPVFQRAALNIKIAHEDKVQTRAALLPTASATVQYIFTQGNGSGVNRFILNNAVHEYVAEGSAHETLSATLLAQYRRSIIGEMLTRDQLAITQRGLVVTVVQSYATLVASDNKYKTLQEVTDAAREFLRTTKDLETGGEVARADVVKARLQSSDSEVALQDAGLARERDRLALALLLFPNATQEFEAVDNPGQILSLPSFVEAKAAAVQHNPALDVARDTERAASSDITTAKTGYLPTLSFDYLYGIDATHFATKNGGLPNLGYSASGQLSWQLWNWGATHSQVKAAVYRKQQAVNDRVFAERKLTADLQQFYDEAEMTKSQLTVREEAVRDADESLKLTNLRYRAGQSTALEVVAAQNALSLEANALQDTLTRYATALANLAVLTGNL